MMSSHPPEPSRDDAPIAAFSHCHESIRAQLRDLGELPALLAPAARARAIARGALDFFGSVVLAHHADEERELFPAVLASAAAGPEHDEVRVLVERLTADHRRIEAQWAQLKPGLEQVAKGHDSELDVGQLAALVTRYAAHADHEEQFFLPLAQTVLGRNVNHMEALGLSLHLRHELPKVLSHWGHRV
jgi:hypothetical protein